MIENKERAKREKRQYEEYERFLTEQERAFKEGEYIHPKVFEDLLERYKIKVPPRTLGSFRKNITAIAKDRVCMYSKKSCNIWNTINQLLQKI